MRFFESQFDQILSGAVEKVNVQQMQMTCKNLMLITERRKQLKSILEKREFQIEQLSTGNDVKIGLGMI